MKCKFDELKEMKLYEIGMLNRQITSVIQDKLTPYSNFCIECDNEISTNFCEFCLTNTKKKRCFKFDCVTNKSEIIHVRV